jgi:hypothetical protein
MVLQNHVRTNGTSNSLDNTDGIRVNVGSTQNTIQSNFMSGNITHDCHDDSHGTGTVGTANFWINDVGQTSHPVGLCRPANGGEEDDDRQTMTQINAASGWNPAYTWYASEPLAAQYDWPAAYSTVDTQSLLQLLPAVSVGGRHEPNSAR